MYSYLMDLVNSFWGNNNVLQSSDNYTYIRRTYDKEENLGEIPKT